MKRRLSSFRSASCAATLHAPQCRPPRRPLMGGGRRSLPGPWIMAPKYDSRVERRGHESRQKTGPWEFHWQLPIYAPVPDYLALCPRLGASPEHMVRMSPVSLTQHSWDRSPADRSINPHARQASPTYRNIVQEMPSGHRRFGERRPKCRAPVPTLPFFCAMFRIERV